MMANQQETFHVLQFSATNCQLCKVCSYCLISVREASSLGPHTVVASVFLGPHSKRHFGGPHPPSPPNPKGPVWFERFERFERPPLLSHPCPVDLRPGVLSLTWFPSDCSRTRVPSVGAHSASHYDACEGVGPHGERWGGHMLG